MKASPDPEQDPMRTIRSKYTGWCVYCGSHYYKGTKIRKASSRWFHERCATRYESLSRKERLSKKNQVVAELPGFCKVCPTPIEVGQSIAVVSGGWVHAECAEY